MNKKNKIFKYKKICPECGIKFETNSSQKIYCCKTHMTRVVCRRWYVKHKRKIKDHRIEYMKQKRKELKKEGICIRCFIRPAAENLCHCEECLEKIICS